MLTSAGSSPIRSAEIFSTNRKNASAGNDGGYSNAGFNGGFGGSSAPASDAGDGFMNLPDGIEEDLPFI